MIVDERMVTYINSLDVGNTPFLDELERQACEDFVPIIRREMQSFLKVLLAVHRPAKILEVGTAVGFSTLLMSEYTGQTVILQPLKNMKKEFPLPGKILKKQDGKTGLPF